MIKKRMNVFELFFYLLILISSGVVLALPWALDSWRNVLVFLSIVFTFSYFMTQKIPLGKMQINFKFYLIIYWVIFFVQSILSISRYNYTVYEYFYAARTYLWFIIVFPLFFILVKNNNFEKILINIIKITLLALLMRTLVWSVYVLFGVEIFKNLLFEYGISWSRVGSFRIDATPLISISIIGTFFFYEKTKQRKFIFYLLLIFLYLFFVTQTRTLLLGSICTIVCMIIFKKRTTDIKFLVFILTIFILVISASLGMFDRIIAYLDLDSGLQSLGYRYYEFEYYFSLLENDNWKLGLGILSSQNVVTDSILFGNLSTPMYLDDLGIFGLFVQFGLLSLPLYFSFLFSVYAVMKKCFNSSYSEYGLFLMGALVYYLLVSVPLDLFGIQRSFSIPIIFAFVGYIENLVKSNKKK